VKHAARGPRDERRVLINSRFLASTPDFTIRAKRHDLYVHQRWQVPELRLSALHQRVQSDRGRANYLPTLQVKKAISTFTEAEWSGKAEQS
jgi:hypothetical protein